MPDPNEKQKQQEEEAHQRSAPSGKVVYKAILQEGNDELERPSSALFWSGLAAGLSMGFSLVTEGLLRHYLPDRSWTPLVTKFGYSIGFLIVILGRQQLFTENTLTPILPLLVRKDRRTLLNVLRLWGVVLLANMVGCLIIALLLTKTPAFEHDVRRVFLEISREATKHPFGTTLIKGIFAGWLIALMVWLLPFAETARVLVIIIVTYVIGIAHFSHIIAGSVEAFALGWAQERSWGDLLGGYVLPTLIGGVTLVAALNHAQVVAGGKGEDI